MDEGRSIHGVVLEAPTDYRSALVTDCTVVGQALLAYFSVDFGHVAAIVEGLTVEAFVESDPSAQISDFSLYSLSRKASGAM